MLRSAIHSVFGGSFKRRVSTWLIVLTSIFIFPNNTKANECNGVNLAVTIRDCYCISFQAFHNGHCYCTVYWDFGNGNTPVDNGCSVQKTECYAGPGTYTVSVYVDCPGGDCATSVTVVIPPENIDADFSASTVCEGFCTQFTDFSTGTFQYWLWDFGDGNTSTQQNPCYTYAAGGTYSVNLEVSDANGCEADTTRMVQVYDRPIVDAGTYAVVCSGSSATIGGTPTASFSPGPYTYAWSPSSGLSCTTCPNPIGTPMSTGPYSVTVTDLYGCIDSSTMLFQVNPNPTAIFSVDTPCLGFDNTFIDQSLGLNTNWDWSFGDGGTDTLQNPTHLYAADGTYSVTLMVTTDSGCTHTIPQDVIVDPLPQVDFSVANVCLYDSAHFFDNSAINYPDSIELCSWLWDFGDGTTSNQTNPVHIYNIDGTYTIRLVITSQHGCIDSLTKQLIIYPVPVALFTTNNECVYDTAFFTDNSTLTSGAIVNWDWDFDDGNTSTIQSPSNKYVNPNTNYQVQLIVTSNFGCQDSITKLLVIHPKPLAGFTVEDVCVYETAEFFDSSSVPSGHPDLITSWIYDFGDGTPVDNGPNTTHDYATYDTLTVTLYIETDSACKDTAWEEIIIHPEPETWFVADTTQGCEPFPVNFSDSTTIPGAYTITEWDWDLGDGTTWDDQTPPEVVYWADNLTTQGEFTITLITESDVGCVDTLIRTNMIHAWPLPVAVFTEGPNPATILYPYITFVNLSLTDTFDNTTYYWDMDDGFYYQTSTDSDYTHVYSNIDTGTYITELIVENNWGCLDTAYDSIRVKGDYLLFVPNTFTPNNDGLNDVFIPQGIGFRDLAKFEFLIFDRWGDLIFKSDNVLNGWDGKANGGRFEAQQDVYVWLVLASDFEGVKHKYVGHVTLLR